MRRTMLVLWLGLALSAGCGTAASDGDAPTDGADGASDVTSDVSPDGSGDVTDDCGGCPPGESCVAGACEFDEPDEDLHWDCGGGIYCENGQIWIVPVSDDPDAEDPCAPSLQETCEYGCENVALDRYDDSTWCLPEPEPCSAAAQGIVGTEVPFTQLNLPCWDDPADPPPADGVTLATSGDALFEGLQCQVGEPIPDIDYTQSRVALIRGSTTDEPQPIAWALALEDAIQLGLNFYPFTSGIDMEPEESPYLIFVELPASETPVTVHTCTLPMGPEPP